MLAERVQFFTESVIREMTRLAQKHNAVNLAQGMPDYNAPQAIRDAACRAIQEGYNQYAVTWGAPALRQAIAEKAKAFNGIDCDPDRHVTVCCGATECMMATLLAIINPGDEVIIFQPFYENYGPDGLLSGANPVWVHLEPPDWSYRREALEQAFSPRTKAIILNTPNNPTGRVFSLEELRHIAELCQRHNVLVVTDEIYEHLIYTDQPHISIASLPGMFERTITISGLSKTFSVTGWRLGYVIAPEALTVGIRRVHDFLTVGAPHPLQMAGAEALRFPPSYYEEFLAEYRHRRDVFLPYLRDAGFQFRNPDGAYYVMVDIRPVCPDPEKVNDVDFVRWLVEEIGVAAVPGSSFHQPKSLGNHLIRFMFAKREETLHEAGERLLRIGSRTRSFD